MGGSCHILAVEDDANDALLIERALKKTALEHTLTVCRSLQEGLNYLEQASRGSDTCMLPRLIISDLRLGVEHGFTLLQWVRQNPKLAYVPFVFLSGSMMSSAVKEAYGLHANSVVIKPTDFQSLIASLDAIATYWCQIALLPE